MKQHLGRQSGVQKVDVNLLDGKVDVTPKEDGRIDPAELLKATYDSGVSVAEMDMEARGKVAQDSAGRFGLAVSPKLFFVFAPNELSKSLESAAGTSEVTIRGQLYKKPPGKKKAEPGKQLQLLILEIERRE